MLVFLMLVFTGQGNVYLVRERNRAWNSHPSLWLIIASMADVIVVSFMAATGVLMAAIPWPLVVILFLTVVTFLIAIDGLKVRLFRQFGVR